MPFPPVIQSIVDWLRVGYPDGVPKQDYIPLLALLGRHLSPEEVSEVVSEIVGDGTGRSTVLRRLCAAIETVTASPALESDVARVSARLEAIRREAPAGS